MARYRLIDVGRGKFNGLVEVDSESQLIRECKKHLGSNGVEIIWEDEDAMDKGKIAAGFHIVGRVQIEPLPLQIPA